MTKVTEHQIVIVGAGVTGLSCARTLQQHGIRFTIFEKSDRPGGRIKTDRVDGYQLDHGFQVLQTGYPGIDQYLDINRLQPAAFPAGVAVRCAEGFHVVADPRRYPSHLISTAFSPVGSFGDRLRLFKLARSLASRPMESIFEEPEKPAREFLKDKGFSNRFIERFCTPFFAGACLDLGMESSSRIFNYVTRLFATGDAVLPAEGMAAIPEQLIFDIPRESIRYNQEVVSVQPGIVTLADGSTIESAETVVAVPQSVCAELLQVSDGKGFVNEACVYFSSEWRPPLAQPFLVLNGEGSGPVNNIAFPSLIADSYAPPGKTLIALVVLGDQYVDRDDLEDLVRRQCGHWFGPVVDTWTHLKTYRIRAALPNQTPPTNNPYLQPERLAPGLTVCGESAGLPGLLWALMSGAMAGERIVSEQSGSAGK